MEPLEGRGREEMSGTTCVGPRAGRYPEPAASPLARYVEPRRPQEVGEASGVIVRSMTSGWGATSENRTSVGSPASGAASTW